MIIKNTTTCNNNMINQAAVVSNSKIETYRKKKLIYNCIGLVSGIGIGHMVSKAINPDYTNIVFEIIKIMQESIEQANIFQKRKCQ